MAEIVLKKQYKFVELRTLLFCPPSPQWAYPKVGGAYEKRIKSSIKNKFFMDDSLRISHAPPTFGYARPQCPQSTPGTIVVKVTLTIFH